MQFATDATTDTARKMRHERGSEPRKLATAYLSLDRPWLNVSSVTERARPAEPYSSSTASSSIDSLVLTRREGARSSLSEECPWIGIGGGGGGGGPLEVGSINSSVGMGGLDS